MKILKILPREITYIHVCNFNVQGIFSVFIYIFDCVLNIDVQSALLSKGGLKETRLLWIDHCFTLF